MAVSWYAGSENRVLRLPLTSPLSRSSQPGVALYTKKNSPWRRVVRTVRVAEGSFYDELECGHRESHDCQAKKRRCRTCADLTFPRHRHRAQEPIAPDDRKTQSLSPLVRGPNRHCFRGKPACHTPCLDGGGVDIVGVERDVGNGAQSSVVVVLEDQGGDLARDLMDAIVGKGAASADAETEREL